MIDREDFDAQDEEKVFPRVNPFRVTIWGRWRRNFRWGFQSFVALVTWPLLVCFRFLAAATNDFQWRISKRLSVVFRWWGRFWRRAMQVFRLDRALDRVDAAARSTKKLVRAIRVRTIGSPWLHQASKPLSARRRRLRQARNRRLRRLTRRLSDVLDFVGVWLRTREYRQLWLGMPGFMMMIPLVACAVRLPFQTSALTAKHYRLAANVAMEEQDLELAKLCFQKLSQLGHMNEMATLRAALFAASQGEWSEAYGKMQQIVSLSVDAASAEAHLWIAQAIAEGNIEQSNPDADKLLEQHLRGAIKTWPDDGAHLLLWLADVCRQSDRGQEASECLAKIEPTDLDLSGRSKMAEIHAVLGQRAEAYRLARSTIADLMAKDEQRRPLTPTDYLVWGASAELLGDIPGAADVILRGLQMHPDDATLHATAPLICATRYDLMPNYSEADKRRRVAFLEDLLEVSVDAEPCWTRIAVLVNDDFVGDKAQRLIDNARCPLPSRTQQALGDMAMSRGDRKAARQFYRDAVDQDQANHVALNNLAYLYAHVEPQRLPVALELANRAVVLSPQNSHYLETRGQIFLLLERWTAAIEDLSLALNGLPDNESEIHQALALALGRIGQSEQAQLHAEAAKRGSTNHNPHLLPFRGGLSE